jgi:hypothetical protein
MIDPSLAYIDAGTGSMLATMLAGGVGAVGVVVKLYWRKLKRLLRIGKPEIEETDSPS